MVQQKPMIVINFKTYKKGTGQKALELAKIMDELKNNKVELIAAVQNCDIYRISNNVEIPIFAQHIDATEYGSNTGKDLPGAIKEAGAAGTLINHSEDPLPDVKHIEEVFSKAEENELKNIICVPSPELAEEVSKLGPEYIAYEPPELIGGNVSVTTKPNIIKDVINRVKSINENITILTGAGVKKEKDVKKALELGTKGVLVASGIVKAGNPKEIIKNFTNACK